MISEKKKGGCDFAVASPLCNWCLVGEAARHVSAGASDSNPTREGNPVVHGNDGTACPSGTAVRNAVVVADSTTTQNYAENRPENGASRRAASDASVATNRRRTARVGNLNRLWP